MVRKILAIGGATIEIYGFCQQMVHDGENRGRVVIRQGGSARNIAENLARFGADVALLSVLGNDPLTQMLKKTLDELGVDTQKCLPFRGVGSAAALSLIAPDGTRHLTVSDPRALEQITPEYIFSCTDYIRQFDVIVPDANLPAGTLAYLCKSFCEKSMVFDPVSTAKAEKTRGLLGKFDILKMNALEARHLSGIQNPERAAREFVRRGAQKVYITLGERGALCADAQGENLRTQALPITAINATGAGDAFTACVALGECYGWDIERCLNFATVCASMTIHSENAVLPELTYDLVEQKMAQHWR